MKTKFLSLLAPLLSRIPVIAIGISCSDFIASASLGDLIAGSSDIEAVDGETYSSWTVQNGCTLSNLNNSNGNTINANISGSKGAIFAHSNGIIHAKDITLTNSGGNGLWATGFGEININRGSITTTGHGIAAYSGGVVYGNNLSIKSTGAEAVMAKFDGIIHLSNSTVVSDKIGIFVNQGGAIYLSNVDITSVTAGVRASEWLEKNKYIWMEDMRVSTTGESGYGVQAAQNAVIDSNDLSVTTGGSKAYGVYSADGSIINLDGTNVIQTSGTNGYGLLVRYTNSSQDTQIYLEEDATLKITTTSGGFFGLGAAHAICAEADNANDNNARRIIQLNGTIDVTTRGAGAHGFMAVADGSEIHAAAGGTVVTEKSGAIGLYAGGGGIITAANLEVTAKGSGIRVESSSLNMKLTSFSGSSSVTLQNSAISSDNYGVELSSSEDVHNVSYSHTGGTVSSANHAFYVKGGTSTNQNAIFLDAVRVTPGEGKDLLRVNAGTQVVFSAKGSILHGDMTVEKNDAQVDATLSGNTRFTGATSNENTDSIINLSLQDTTKWFLTGTSVLTSVNLSSSSSISFLTNGSNSFTNIHAAVVMLASGSMLNLDQESGVYSAGDIITLFIGASGDDFINDGALLVTLDNMSLEYLDLNNGQFQLTGEMTEIDPIPDPEPEIPGVETPSPEAKEVSPEYRGTLTMNSLWSSASNLKTMGRTASAQMGVSRLLLDKSSNYWVSGLGDFISHRGKGNVDGYEYNGGGYAVGADTFITDRHQIGLAFGHLIGTNKSKNYSSKIDQTTLGGILYGAWYKQLNNRSKDLFSAEGMISYGNTSNKIDSYYQDGTRTKGKWDNNTWYMELKGTWTHNLRNNWTLTPFVAIEYTQSDSKAFTEDNVIGRRARRFEKADMKNLSLPVGTGIGKTFDCGSGIKWNHGLSVSYVPDVYRENPESTVTRVLNNQSWTATSSQPARNAFRANYGTQVQWNPTWASYASYELETGSRFMYHRATIGVSAAF